MGALLSCLQRADDPSLPLTLPSVFLPSKAKDESNGSIFTRVLKIFSTVSDTVLDFCWNFVKITTAEDDQTPIRSGDDGVEFRPVRVATMTFSLDHVKQIKTKVDAVWLLITFHCLFRYQLPIIIIDDLILIKFIVIV